MIFYADSDPEYASLNQGFCPHANTVYSRHLQSCATQAEADPYTLCPEEFRITVNLLQSLMFESRLL